MDYLTQPLASRIAMLKKHGKETLRKFAPAYGYIHTREGRAPLRDAHGTIHSENHPVRLRFHNWADKLARINHTGWYVDNFQHETVRGMVFLLPHGRFLAGYSDPWNTHNDGSGPFNFAPEVFDDETAAAREADRLAERYAERCREDDARETAKCRIAEIANEELPALRAQVRELAAGIRASTLAPACCDVMRQKIRQLRVDMHKLRALSARLQENFWEAVPA